MIKFRFQDMKIWMLAIEITDELLDIADDLEVKRLFRFAEPDKRMQIDHKLQKNIIITMRHTLCALRYYLFSMRGIQC